MLSNKNITGLGNDSDFNLDKMVPHSLKSATIFSNLPAYDNQFTSSFLKSSVSAGND